MNEYVMPLHELSIKDISKVGGKNASLGEMLQHLTQMGVRIPGGFATTAYAFQIFLQENNLEEKIAVTLEDLDVHDIAQLRTAGSKIRKLILEAAFPLALQNAIADAYQSMGENRSVAVRSSATAEDLPDASFAGQQETFLHIQGLENVLEAIKQVFASLYNDRAIAYRVHKGFMHSQVALSAGIQLMVRSDLATSGVIFTLDTESGFREVVFLTAAYGLGEMVVQGKVNPDEFYVSKRNLRAKRPAIIKRTLGTKAQKMIFSQEAKTIDSLVTVEVAGDERQIFCLTDAEIKELAHYAVLIEEHYGRPMDIEWAKDGEDNQLYIVQARPETVKARQTEMVRTYRLTEHSNVLIEGRAIGQKINRGVVRKIKDISEMQRVQSGDILVTKITDPDWEPIMKKAAAIVTDLGGRTSHAAIVARELGIPAVVGCGDATEKLKEGDQVTVSCAEGEIGKVYEGLLAIETNDSDIKNLPKIPVKLMMNIANPDQAFTLCQLPNEGVGLARLEFIINRMIGVHPQTLLAFNTLPAHFQKEVAKKIAGYASAKEFYIAKLVEGIATISEAFYPRRVIVRTSDFKSNEYAHLLGGSIFEPQEENPMIGFRGVARYVSERFQEAFALECEALRRVRFDMGYDNLAVMLPFVRSLEELEQSLALLKQYGLSREQDMTVIMMCEIPMNALMADELLEYVDGFSIGSNDMTQLTLGVDRDANPLISHLFDERSPAVKRLLAMAIQACKQKNKYIGICGQAPSDHIDFAEWLVEQGIETISLNPDSLVKTWQQLGKKFS